MTEVAIETRESSGIPNNPNGHELESLDRPGEPMGVDEYYGHLFAHSIPGLPEAAEAEGVDPLEYMRRHGAFAIPGDQHELHERLLSDAELDSTVRGDDGVYRTPGTAGLHDSLDEISGHMPFIGDGSAGVDVEGTPRFGFPTPSRKLELFAVPPPMLKARPEIASMCLSARVKASTRSSTRSAGTSDTSRWRSRSSVSAPAPRDPAAASPTSPTRPPPPGRPGDSRRRRGRLPRGWTWRGPRRVPPPPRGSDDDHGGKRRGGPRAGARRGPQLSRDARG